MKSEEFIIQAMKELNENMNLGFNKMNNRFNEMNNRMDRVEERLERIESEIKNHGKDINFLSKKMGEHEIVLNRLTGQ